MASRALCLLYLPGKRMRAWPQLSAAPLLPQPPPAFPPPQVRPILIWMQTWLLPYPGPEAWSLLGCKAGRVGWLQQCGGSEVGLNVCPAGRDRAVPGALMLQAQLSGELHPTWGMLPCLPAR